MNLAAYFNRQKHIAPLATFRVAFGLLMLCSIVRFWTKGWIVTQYITPQYFFTYYGFDWVKPFGEVGMYVAFALMAISAFFIAIGLFYRYSSLLFFLLFTYVELIDKSNYLNHYYFVSLVAFLMIFVPANAYYSLDVKLGFVKSRTKIPAWSIDILKLQLGITYFYAGIAKLNADWLLKALPLKIWLPAKSHIPLIGKLLNYKWTAYIFSWFGAIYDLVIPFFLLWNKSRWFAYVAVIAFHIMTAVLFPIGMFPYIMIGATLIFFSEEFHKKIWAFFGFPSEAAEADGIVKKSPKAVSYFLVIYTVIQLLIPFRNLLYPGKLFWHEQGYRFSWRVMLMEKSGYTSFTLVEQAYGKSMKVDAAEYLTPMQVKMMSSQPDMILQFSHHLRDQFKPEFGEIAVYANSFVTLNGSGSKKFVNDSINLSSQKRGFHNKIWILPHND
jgi:hypothetical protein